MRTLLAILCSFRGATGMASASLVAGLLFAGPVPGATITVDEALDDDPAVDNGACSLREAIIAANTNSGVDGCIAGEAAATAVDKIIFDASLDGTPLTLSVTGTGEGNAMTGDLDILEDVRIIGNGGLSTGFFGGGFAANTLVDADGIDRVIDVLGSDISVTIEQLAVGGGGGVDNGAGIRTSGNTNLTLRNVLVTENLAGIGSGFHQGGGIMAFGDLTLENSAVFNNAVQTTGADNVFGGGIHATANLTVRHSVIVNNEAEAESGTAAGGGVNFFTGTGSLLITESILSDNSAFTTMGGSFAIGGGLRTGDGDATIEQSGIINNSVRATGNGIGRGGGVFSFGAPVTVTNSTISENSADSDTGIARGGGWYVFDDTVSFNNVSFPSNSAVSGTAVSGQAGGLDNDHGGTVTLSNSALIGNSDSSGGSPDCSGPLTSADYNILGDNTGCTFTPMANDLVGDVAGGGPTIPFADVFEGGGATDNGGDFMVGEDTVPQFTVAPSADSLALDAGDPNVPGSGGTCATEDQRGGNRPADGDDDGSAACDIGAFELNATFGISPSAGGSGGGGGTIAPLMLFLLAWPGLVRLLAASRGRHRAGAW